MGANAGTGQVLGGGLGGWNGSRGCGWSQQRAERGPKTESWEHQPLSPQGTLEKKPFLESQWNSRIACVLSLKINKEKKTEREMGAHEPPRGPPVRSDGGLWSGRLPSGAQGSAFRGCPSLLLSLHVSFPGRPFSPPVTSQSGVADDICKGLRDAQIPAVPSHRERSITHSEHY